MFDAPVLPVGDTVATHPALAVTTVLTRILRIMPDLMREKIIPAGCARAGGFLAPFRPAVILQQPARASDKESMSRTLKAVACHAFAIASLAVILSCSGDSGTQSTTPTDTVASVDLLTPPAPLLVDETYQLSGTVHTTSGGELPSDAILWSSSNTAVAIVEQGPPSTPTAAASSSSLRLPPRMATRSHNGHRMESSLLTRRTSVRTSESGSSTRSGDGRCASLQRGWSAASETGRVTERASRSPAFRAEAFGRIFLSSRSTRRASCRSRSRAPTTSTRSGSPDFLTDNLAMARKYEAALFGAAEIR